LGQYFGFYFFGGKINNAPHAQRISEPYSGCHTDGWDELAPNTAQQLAKLMDKTPHFHGAKTFKHGHSGVHVNVCFVRQMQFLFRSAIMHHHFVLYNKHFKHKISLLFLLLYRRKKTKKREKKNERSEKRSPDRLRLKG